MGLPAWVGFPLAVWTAAATTWWLERHRQRRRAR